MLNTEQPERSIRRPLVIAVAPFVVAGLLAPAYSHEEFELGLTLWQAFVLWPIGGLLLVGPVAIARGIRRDPLFAWTVAGIAACGVMSIVLVSRSDDAQAGIAFLYAPFFGCAVAIAALLADKGLDRLVEQR